MYRSRVEVHSAELVPEGMRDVAQRPVDYPALAALCDIFYPRVFLRLGGFRPGHFDQSAQLWTRDGVLLATSHQVVYFKGSL